MRVHDHRPLDELQRLAKAITPRRVWIRYQAVILAIPGQTAEQIAQALGCSRRSVQTWVAHSNQGGPQALAERPHTGRPPRLAGPQLLRFQERLEAGPQPEDRVGAFRGHDLRHILEHEFGVLMSLQAVYDLLHSCRPRPALRQRADEPPSRLRPAAPPRLLGSHAPAPAQGR